MSEVPIDWPAPARRLALRIPGVAGDIEAAWSAPREPGVARRVLLICHPHPLFGGTMQNKVVTTLAAAAHDAGWYALRFNFRGVGGSVGSHDDGQGETEDCCHLADWLRSAAGAESVGLAGFSFGGFVALQAAADVAPACLLTVAPAWRYMADGVPAAWPLCPWLCIHAEDDDVIDPADTRRAVQRAPHPPQLETPQHGGHFFHGALDAVRAPARSMLQSLA